MHHRIDFTEVLDKLSVWREEAITRPCSYRVMEDGESGNPAYWVELRIEGDHLELSPGDIVIEKRQ